MVGKVLAVSSFRDTAPVDYLDQPRFLNAAVLLDTSLAPLDLLHSLLAIETSLGRERSRVPAKGPRVIDLDVIRYNGFVIEGRELTVPHPAMRERAFVLEPLAEIAPDMIDPVTGITISKLLDHLRDRSIRLREQLERSLQRRNEEGC